MTSRASEPRVHEVLEEYLAALDAGTAPDQKALLDRHPDLAESLASALLGLELVRRGAKALEMPGGGAGADPGPSAAGQILGDYRLLREVGRGGMAVVYEAEQVSLGRRVALKVLPFAAVLDPKQLQRFKNEAMAAAHLRHKNIVPVHAVGSERGVHYYAMQYVEGQSLAAAIGEMKRGGTGEGPKTPISSHGSNREPAYVRMAAALGMQAAEALDHAHQLGIVHRDVKPGNLLVDEAGTLWVTDFGLARSLNDIGLTITGELLGTIRYMSPEQALAKRVPLDHRTDVYSLGATLYELLTLEPAFPGDDSHRVIQDIAFKEPVAPRRLNPALPVDLETVLLKAMTKDPAGRYDTAQEMADDLKRYLEDKPVLARRPSLAARAAKWSRRHRGLVAAAFVVLLVAVASLALGAWRLAREERNTRTALLEAEENLDLAHGAVDEFLVQTGIFGLKDERLPTPARRELLTRALKFYDKYLAHRDDARAHVKRGYVLVNLGRPGDALAAFDNALAADPTDPGHDRSVQSLALLGRGRSLSDLKRREEALAALDRVLEIEPNNVVAHGQRGKILSDMGREEEALAAAVRWIEIDPNDAGAHYNRGVTLRQLGRHEEALAANDRAIELDPLNSAAHHNRSLALGKLERHEEALVAIDRAIVLDPTHASSHYDRGIVLGKLGRKEEALAAYDRAIEIDPNEADAHANRAGILSSLGRAQEALLAVERALEIDPECAEAYGARGQALLALGRRDEALRAHEQEIALKDSAVAQVNLGRTLQDLGRHGEALAAYDRAILIDPSYVAAHGNRATALHELGRDLDALASFDSAIAIDPNNAMAHYNRGGILVVLERHEEALAACDRAVALDPKDALGHYQRGAVLWELRRLEDALAAYDQAIQLDPDMALAHCSRGDVLKKLGRVTDALAAYDRAVDLGERDAAFLNWLAWCRATSRDPQLRNPARAVELAREAVRVAPQEADFWNTLGIALCGTEAWQEALDAFAKSMAGSGGDAFDWFFVAIAHRRLGHTDEAGRWYGKAVAWMEANRPDDEELRRFRDEAASSLGIK